MAHLELNLRRELDATLAVRNADDSVVALGNWRELECRIPNLSLACSYDWTASWLNAYADLVPHSFLELRVGGVLQGLCLVTEGVGQKDGPLPIRTLHVGTAGEPERDSACVEYNALLVTPEWRATFVRHIVEYLEQQRGIDQWNLDGFNATDLADWESFSPVLEVRSEVAHRFDLTIPRREGSDVLASLRGETRRRIRRSIEAFSNLQVDWAESTDEAIEIFEEMTELHQARWTALGEPGAYASRRFTAFHEELLARLVPQRRMMLVRVRDGSQTVGSVQLFNDNNRALLYQRGWAQTDAQKSPGIAIDFLVMDECLRRGFDAYDFLAYESRHKRQLSNASSEIVWARRKHSSWKYAALDAVRGLKGRIREWSNRKNREQTHD